MLARAFVKEPTASDVSPTTATLLQVRKMGRAIMQMAEEQIEFERRLTTTESRLERAAQVYGDLTRRVTTLEQKRADSGRNRSGHCGRDRGRAPQRPGRGAPRHLSAEYPSRKADRALAAHRHSLSILQGQQGRRPPRLRRQLDGDLPHAGLYQRLQRLPDAPQGQLPGGTTGAVHGQLDFHPRLASGYPAEHTQPHNRHPVRRVDDPAQGRADLRFRR